MSVTKIFPPIGLVFLALGIFMPKFVSLHSNFYLLCLSVVFSGWHIFRNACLCIAKRRVDANVLITIAIIGLISLSMLLEASIYICIIGIMNFVQAILTQDTLAFLQKKWRTLPVSAIKLNDGHPQETPAEDILPDDQLILSAGQILPTDGIVQKGHGKISPSLVGQYVMPQYVKENELILAGSKNLENDLEIRALSSQKESLLAKIPVMLEDAVHTKKLEETKLYNQEWSRRLLIFILFMALPFFFFGSSMLTWLHYSLSLLLIFAPYNAIIEASSLLLSKTLDKATKLGIIVRDPFAIGEAAAINAVAFEKYTTLANGNLIMSNIYAPYPFTRKEVIFCAAALANAAGHPLMQSIAAQTEDLDLPKAEDITLIDNSGFNIHAILNGKDIVLGNNSFLEKNGIKTSILLRKYSEYLAHGSTVLFVAINGEPAGLISFIDDIHPQIFSAIGQIRSNNIQNVIMLTKEQERAAASASKPLGFTAAISNLGNAGKAPIIQKLHYNYGSVLVVGDAQKDAALMQNADISVAVNSEKNLQYALETTDIVLLGDYFYSLPRLFAIGKQERKTLSTYKKIIFFCKLLLLVLAFLQYLHLWQIILLDGLVGTLLVFNCMRLARKNS